MRRLEHVMIGAGFGCALAHVTGGSLAETAVLAGIGAALPDLDLHWSSRQRLMPGSNARLLEHRGPTHSFLAILLVYAGFALGGLPGVGLALATGYTSHLLADALSPLGEPFLWPLAKRRYRVMPRGLRLRSGTRLVEFPIAALVLAAGWFA